MNPISPKVTMSVLAGIFVSALLGNVATIDPTMLAWFGPWSPFIYGTAVSLLSGLAGYYARDPLRDLGAVHADAGTPYPTAPGAVAGPALLNTAALPLVNPADTATGITAPKHAAGGGA